MLGNPFRKLRKHSLRTSVIPSRILNEVNVIRRTRSSLHIGLNIVLYKRIMRMRATG